MDTPTPGGRGAFVAVLVVLLVLLLAVVLLGVGVFVAVSDAHGQSCTGGGAGSTLLASATTGVQVSDLNPAQMDAAAIIVAVGEQLQVPGPGIVVALAVAHQESRFQNYANDGTDPRLRPEQRDVVLSLGYPHDAVGRDHGSVDAFQQQFPGWGTVAELMNPPTAARKFYEALLRVPGWASMAVTVAAQTVQQSQFPAAYADNEALARKLYTHLAGAGASAGNLLASAPCTSGAPTRLGSGSVSATGWALPVDPGTYSLSSGYGPRPSPAGGAGTFHAGLDFAAPTGTPIRAAATGVVTYAGFYNGGFGNLVIVATAPNVLTYYAHQSALVVAAGAQVTAGQVIGAAGATGDSTGAHLHFEVRLDGKTTDPLPFLRQQGLDPGALAIGT